MAWRVEDRRKAEFEQTTYLTDEMKKQIADRYFPRYPTKRAVLLPALHIVQHHHGWIPPKALAEVAEFLGLAPAEVLDTASFYEEYWLKPKGKYLVQVCRSLSCEICGSRQLTKAIRQKLRVDVGQTTADGRFTLVELECLGSCGTAPVMMINDVLYENLLPEEAGKILDGLPEDPHEFRDPTIDWESGGGK